MLRLPLALSLVLALVFPFEATAGGTDWKALCKRGSAKVVTELEVGGGPEESEEEPVFLQPYDVAVAPDGSFYVLDYDGFIVHFGPDGTERNRFGRKGEGPGELGDPVAMEMDASGRLIVFEVSNHRFSFFHGDGEFIKTVSRQGYIDGFECTRDGNLVVVEEPSEMTTPGHKQLVQLVRYDGEMQHPVVIDSMRVSKFFMLNSGQIASTPYYTQMGFCVLPDGGIAFGRDDRYEIRVLGSDLRPRYTLRRDIAAPRITDKDREAYYNGFGNVSAEFIDRLRQGVPWPKHKTCILDVFPDGAFVIVVRRDNDEAPPTLDVFEGERFIGEVSAPEFRSPRAIMDGHFYRPFRLPNQLPSVARYRIE